jgi:hypothetical protein
MDPRTAARLLGGHIAAGQISCPGPGHSSKDRSMSVRFDPQAPDGFVVFSHAGDDPLACKDYVREKFGMPSFARRRPRTRPTSELRRLASTQAVAAAVSDDDDRARAARAIDIWNHAPGEVTSPLLEAYLAHRGVLEAARPSFGHAIRFHPRCPFGPNVWVPCMIALVVDIGTNEPLGIHRTAISPEGRNTEVGGRKRMAFGRLAGGAVKLTPDEDVTVALGIAEGLETALSMKLLSQFGRTPVWSVLSAGGVKSFPVLSGIESLWIGVDHDVRGERAAKTCSERWTEAGAEAFRVIPRTVSTDLNDLIVGG